MGGGKKKFPRFHPPDPDSPELTPCLLNGVMYCFAMCALLTLIVVAVPSCVALIIMSTTTGDAIVVIAMGVVMGVSTLTVLLLGGLAMTICIWTTPH
jgi:hypothetical protein